MVSDLEASLGVAVLFGAGPRLAAPAATAPPAPVAVEPVPPSPATAAAPSATPVPAAASVAPPPPSPPPPPAPPRALTPPPVAGPHASLAQTPRPATPPPFFAGRTRLPSLKELLGRAKEVQFDGSSSSKLSIVSLPLIGQLAEAMAKDPNVQLEIVAHTAGSGDAARDLALSKRRADAVKRALGEREVSPSRLLSIGRGSAEPVAPNLTRAGRKLNERVELRLWVPEKVVR